MTTRLLFVPIAMSLLVIGCGSDDEQKDLQKSSSAARTTAPTPTPRGGSPSGPSVSAPAIGMMEGLGAEEESRVNVEGTWRWSGGEGDMARGFTLRLDQKGSKINGSFETRDGGGNVVDGGATPSTVTGRASGSSAKLDFTSSATNTSGSATVKPVKGKDQLEWKITKRGDGELWLPETAVLERVGEGR